MPDTPESTPPSKPSGDLARIRQTLARALETVSLHEANAAAAETQEARDFYNHLAAEQKEHVVEAITMLRTLDPSFDALFAKEYSPEYFQKPVEVPVPLPRENAFERLAKEPHHLVHGLPAPPSPLAGQLTVGSLRNR